MKSVFIRVYPWLLIATQVMAADPISDALQKGLFEEEANHNLDAAIKAYQSVIDQTAEQRKFTATAVFRLGECYRKLNKTNEAVAQYQRVVREFSDVSPLATLSQQNLVGLGINVSKETATTAATSAEAEEIEKIKAMIKYSPDLIDAPHLSGMTPLSMAAFKGYLAVATFLLDNKADVNAKNQNAYTALHHAADQGHKSMVELLLKHGADVNAGSEGSHRPLDRAVSKGYRSIVEVLLAAKADINAKGERGWTPLHVAIQRRQTAVASLLLDRGADVNVQDNEGFTALHHAVASFEMTQAILSHKPNLELINRVGETPLIDAAGRGDVRSVQLLLEAGADVNKVASNGSTPLLAAMMKHNADKVRLLVEHKADPNEQWKYHKGGPLAWVLERLNDRNLSPSDKTKLTEIAELLRQYGAKQLADCVPYIGISRNGKELTPKYLKQDPQGLNRFTLFELLAYLYDGRGPDEYRISVSPPFPDFSNIQIIRQEPHGGKRIIKFNLEDALISGDCGKDVLLEWGDVVDIPEKDHKLSETWTELSVEMRNTLSTCLERKVNITIKGETTSLTLRPKFWGNRGLRPLNSGDPLPFLRLAKVLEASKLLRASSDRTQVQVTRKIGSQLKMFYFNLDTLRTPRSPEDAVEDLLLQDGDTIYVPDKT